MNFSGSEWLRTTCEVLSRAERHIVPGPMWLRPRTKAFS